MRHLIPALLAAATLGASAPLHAQTTPDWVSRLLTAARLPVETSEARREGVANDEIRSVLDAMRRSRVPAHEAVDIIDTARVVRREHGPVDNFGAFVQAQLASGKRGRDLAAAIRAEHARAGKGSAGRGADVGPGRGQGQGQGRGRDAAPDTGRERGRSDAAAPGQGRDRRPDSAANPRGKSSDKPNEKPETPRGKPARPNR